MRSFNDYQTFLTEGKLVKSKPHKARDVLANPSLVPNKPGLYYWWLHKDYADQLNLKGHTVDNHVLVYHGTGKDLNERLVKWELADLNGKYLRKRVEASHEKWVKSRAKDAVKKNPGVAQPARTVRALMGTHWVDYEATQEFLDNLMVTWVEVPIKADRATDEKAFKSEYEYKVVKRLETSQVRKHSPGLNIKQLADRFVAKQRTEMGKLSYQKTLEYAKTLFGDDLSVAASKPRDIANKVEKKVAAKSKRAPRKIEAPAGVKDDEARAALLAYGKENGLLGSIDLKSVDKMIADYKSGDTPAKIFQKYRK